MIANSASKDYGSGYNETKVLVSLGSAFAAANAAIEYNSECKLPENTTGWFLPSAGQFYAIFSGLGKYVSSNNFDWYVTNFGRDVRARIQSALEKVGPGNYTPFKNDIYITCQLKYSCQYHVIIFMERTDIPESIVMTCLELYNSIPLRPFMAF